MGKRFERREVADERVIARVRAAGADGASAAMIASAYLGQHRRMNFRSLEAIGLGVASRLCRLGAIAPTRSNRFVVR